MMEDLKLHWIDENHVWINGKQYVSLKRAGEMVEEHWSACKGKWQHIVDPVWCGGGYTKCTACGNGFSDKYYHEVSEWKHCPNCGIEMVVNK